MERNTGNVDMYAYVRTVVGKFLIILLSSMALVGCNTTKDLVYNSHSTYASTNEDYGSASSIVGVISNYSKWSVNRMNKYDRKQQEQAVFFALNNLPPGQQTEWYNGNTGAHGLVKVAASYPQGSGYCRVIWSQISYNGHDRAFSETACINSVDNTWRFVR